MKIDLPITINKQRELVRIENHIMRDPNSGCWLWTGSLNNKGYGWFRRHPKTLLAHRVSYEIAYGPIPINIEVLHRCDTPACVCPHHLRLGTHDDNMKDAAHKQRMQQGERRYNAKLSEADVHEARASALSNAALGRRFNVSPSLISEIRSGKRWKHLSTQEVAHAD